jgi:hypothetical protein
MLRFVDEFLKLALEKEVVSGSAGSEWNVVGRGDIDKYGMLGQNVGRTWAERGQSFLEV